MSRSWFKSLVGRLNGGAADPEAGRHEAALRELRAAVARDLGKDRAALEALLRMPAALGLPDEEVELEVETVQGALDLLALREAAERDGLPVVVHQHKALGADTCHFGASAFLANDGNRDGRLFLTNRRLVFVASPMVTLSWSAIASIDQDARDVIVLPTTGEAIYQFRYNSFSDARRGAFIARRLKHGSSATAAGDPPGSR